jgi:hypothetical protein
MWQISNQFKVDFLAGNGRILVVFRWIGIKIIDFDQIFEAADICIFQ